MKLIAACMLLLAFAACSIHALDFAENVSLPPGVLDEEPQEYMADFLNDDDDDFEIVDMDDALQKYRMLKAISRIVEEGQAMDTNNPLRKRFIGSLFKDIKNKITEVTKKVTDFVAKKYNQARDSFNKVAKNVDFKASVDKAVPFLHAGMSKDACKTTIDSAATAILGDAASIVEQVSGPICDVALTVVEKLSG